MQTIFEGQCMVFENLEVRIGSGRQLPARLYPSAEGATSSPLLILAHGAGAGQASRFMVEFAGALASRGIVVVTFDFPYMADGRRVVDSNSVLESAWRDVVAGVTAAGPGTARRLFIGGKSMGGRIASQVAARPELLAAPVAGLVFLGYPLHPPGKPGQRRDAHLARIGRPMLFVQGERDTFGSAPEVRDLVSRLEAADLHIVERANHSLEPPKRGVKSRDQVFAEVLDLVAAWIARTSP